MLLTPQAASLEPSTNRHSALLYERELLLARRTAGTAAALGTEPRLAPAVDGQVVVDAQPLEYRRVGFFEPVGVEFLT